MAVSVTIANVIKAALGNKEVDYQNDTIKICLMASGFTFDEDNHEAYADISANEVANGNGYTTGGATATFSAHSVDTANDEAIWTFSAVSWTALLGAIQNIVGCIVYDVTASNKIIGYADLDLGSGLDLDAGDSFSITMTIKHT